MQATIDAMQGHYVICGVGQTGTAVLRELMNTQRICVAIEHNHQHIANAEGTYPDLPVLHGDCSDDETLSRAGVQRAARLRGRSRREPEKQERPGEGDELEADVRPHQHDTVEIAVADVPE